MRILTFISPLFHLQKVCVIRACSKKNAFFFCRRSVELRTASDKTHSRYPSLCISLAPSLENKTLSLKETYTGSTIKTPEIHIKKTLEIRLKTQNNKFSWKDNNALWKSLKHNRNIYENSPYPLKKKVMRNLKRKSSTLPNSTAQIHLTKNNYEYITTKHYKDRNFKKSWMKKKNTKYVKNLKSCY